MSSEQMGDLNWTHYPSVKIYVDTQATKVLRDFCSRMVSGKKMSLETAEIKPLFNKIVNDSIGPAVDIDTVLVAINKDALIPDDQKIEVKKCLQRAKKLYTNVIADMDNLKEELDPANYQDVVETYFARLKAKFQETETAAGLSLEVLAEQVK